MRSVMESSSPNQIDKNIITFSCGLACLDLRHAGSEELLRAADVALYEAKNHGRNRIVTYDGPVGCRNQKHGRKPENFY